MGLIKAALGAAGGTLADQWKEFFYCDSMGKDVLVTKGQKRTSGRSSTQKVMTTSFQRQWNCCCRWTVYVDRGTGKDR